MAENQIRFNLPRATMSPEAMATALEKENLQRHSSENQSPQLEIEAEIKTAQEATNTPEEFGVTVQKLARAGWRSTDGAESKIPKPSYYEQGLFLPCYYMTEHDYYLAWHKEAGLRVISGRYATKQNFKKPNGHWPHTMGMQDPKTIPIHLNHRKEWVVNRNVNERGIINEGKWDVVEVTEAEFKDILKAKPDYKSLLHTFGEFDGQLHQYDKYAYKVVLDIKQVTRIW